MHNYCRVGIDIGGTGVKGVAITEHGKALASFDIPTSNFDDNPVEILINQIKKMIDSSYPLSSIGIGASGPVNLKTRLISNPDTLPRFTGIDLVGSLSAALNVPVSIDNDAIAAAYAEYQWTFDRKVESLVMVTLGTGIGVAGLRNGKPVRNLKGEHPESGHTPIPGINHPCYCGIDNCWEQAASRKGLEKLQEIYGNNNPLVWKEYSKFLSDGLFTIINGLDPEVIVIGGSISQYWNNLEKMVYENLGRNIYSSSSLKLVPSTLGIFAGAFGAALIPDIAQSI